MIDNMNYPPNISNEVEFSNYMQPYSLQQWEKMVKSWTNIKYFGKLISFIGIRWLFIYILVIYENIYTF